MQIAVFNTSCENTVQFKQEQDVKGRLDILIRYHTKHPDDSEANSPSITKTNNRV